MCGGEGVVETGMVNLILMCYPWSCEPHEKKD